MKILFVHNGPDIYGASRSLLRLASRLTSDGHGVMVVLPADGPLRQRLEAEGVQVAIYPWLTIFVRHDLRRVLGLMRFVLSVPLSMLYLWRLIRQFKPDIVHTNTSVVLSAGPVARLAGVPHVWHIREFFSEFPLAWRLYRRVMMAFADVVVCVSAAVAEQFPTSARGARILVIHNGFPDGEFHNAPEEARSRFRNDFGIEDGEVVVGVVGAVKILRKGQDTFVRAAALLTDQWPNTRFLLVGGAHPGNDDHPQRVLALAEELRIRDRVVHTGTVQDVSAAYSVLDISVLSSGLPEPFGGVVVESMAFGLPVVGTRHGGTVEQVEDGATGYLVQPNDPQAMAEAIGKLLADPERRREFGRAGRRKFLADFEFEPFYRRITSLYEGLLS